ncbi:peptidylprolyl isomerase [Bacillus bombysepticus]|uniref:peptidylprolyl isomerase n=1 Tax=Bacillus cereus group TaxID=86661 RepID=UPI000BF3F434|nr:MULTISPECIES: peptidylprolyl isomerase [Bacillus cereus group]PFA92982.1 foldase [Bacillus cereus]PFT46197.1 foldase [Bacillus cereus]
MKSSVKRLIMTGLAVGSLTFVSGCSLFDSDSVEYAAKTDSGTISKDELYNRMVDKIGQRTLDDMITLTVLQKKYKVSDGEIDDEIKRLKSEFGNSFNDFLSQNGVNNEEQLKDVIKLDKLKQKLALEHLKIQDKDLKALYEQKKPEIRVSHILVSDETLAKDIKSKIDSGEDFGSLAKEFSQDIATKEKGGDIGYFKEGDMVQAFQDAARKLKVGEVSQPVKTDFGYHVIKLLDEKKLPSFEQMKPQLQSELISNKMDQAKINAEIQKLLDKDNIKIGEEKLKDMYKINNQSKEKPSSK